ncbi:MAG: hypothetical protein OEM29_08710 [Thermoplasmata archaeon]|nr:hypothetical protein [Thermoplasmata archaeon]
MIETQASSGATYMSQMKRKVKYRSLPADLDRDEALNRIWNKVLESSEALRLNLEAPDGERVIGHLFKSWTDKLVGLDDRCLGLYANGLLEHDGKGFTSIFEAEKDWIRSTRTLDLHLGHLMSVELVGRRPWSGGRGSRAKYFFHMPPIPTAKLTRLDRRMAAATRDVGIDEELLEIMKLVNRPLNDATYRIQAKELAGRFWALYFYIGIYLADSLERSLLQKDAKKAANLFRHDMAMMDYKLIGAAYALLTKNRKISKQATPLFREYVREMARLSGLMQ